MFWALIKFSGNADRREKRREALGVDHKRLLYCVNVNYTSLDHLLLGERADIDQMSNAPSITPEGREGGWILFKALLGVNQLPGRAGHRILCAVAKGLAARGRRCRMKTVPTGLDADRRRRWPRRVS